MEHLRAFLIKFIVSLALMYIVLGLIYDVSFSNIFVITLVLGVASYSLGDMAILPRSNNFIATIADFGLAFLVIWLFGNILWILGDNIGGASIFSAALIASVGIAIFEFFFHMYVAKFRESHVHQIAYLRYQTEASEEITPSDLKNLTPSELKNRNQKLID